MPLQKHAHLHNHFTNFASSKSNYLTENLTISRVNKSTATTASCPRVATINQVSDDLGGHSTSQETKFRSVSALTTTLYCMTALVRSCFLSKSNPPEAVVNGSRPPPTAGVIRASPRQDGERSETFFFRKAEMNPGTRLVSVKHGG